MSAPKDWWAISREWQTLKTIRKLDDKTMLAVITVINWLRSKSLKWAAVHHADIETIAHDMYRDEDLIRLAFTKTDLFKVAGDLESEDGATIQLKDTSAFTVDLTTNERSRRYYERKTGIGECDNRDNRDNTGLTNCQISHTDSIESSERTLIKEKTPATASAGGVLDKKDPEKLEAQTAQAWQYLADTCRHERADWGARRDADFPAIRAAVERHGLGRVMLAIDDCAAEAYTWAYVERSLSRGGRSAQGGGGGQAADSSKVDDDEGGYEGETEEAKMIRRELKERQDRFRPILPAGKTVRDAERFDDMAYQLRDQADLADWLFAREQDNDWAQPLPRYWEKYRAVTLASVWHKAWDGFKMTCRHLAHARDLGDWPGDDWAGWWRVLDRAEPMIARVEAGYEAWLAEGQQATQQAEAARKAKEAAATAWHEPDPDEAARKEREAESKRQWIAAQKRVLDETDQQAAEEGLSRVQELLERGRRLMKKSQRADGPSQDEPAADAPGLLAADDPAWAAEGAGEAVPVLADADDLPAVPDLDDDEAIF